MNSAKCFWYSVKRYGRVRYKIKTSSKFGALKRLIMDCKVLFKVLTKFGANFGHFEWMKVNQGEAKRNLVLKKSLFSVNILPPPSFWTWVWSSRYSNKSYQIWPLDGRMCKGYVFKLLRKFRKIATVTSIKVKKKGRKHIEHTFNLRLIVFPFNVKMKLLPN